MKITTAIFDLDGTLLNTLGDLCDSVNASLLPRGFRPISEEQTRDFVGNGIRKLIERALPANSSDELIDACLDDFRSAYEKRLMNRTQPYNGIIPLLRQLRAKGVNIGVLSNKYDLAAGRLVRHFFGDLCAITFGERPGVPRKPDPASALELLRALGGSASGALYIGDSAVDIATAHNAGLCAVGVTWGFRSETILREAGADAIVHRPSELLPLFENGIIDCDAVGQAFLARGFQFTYFSDEASAVTYLSNQCAGRVVTFGGSQTLEQLGLYDALTARGAQIHSHSRKAGHYFQTPDIYICSANALAGTGEVVNIDGNCNRVAGTLFGPRRCIFVCGINKLTADLPSAMARARNIAAPQNAKRLHKNTPCAQDGVCHDCKSPDRICRAMVIHMGPPQSFVGGCEIVLIGKPLGF